jgi:hypothetical protein
MEKLSFKHSEETAKARKFSEADEIRKIMQLGYKPTAFNPRSCNKRITGALSSIKRRERNRREGILHYSCTGTSLLVSIMGQNSSFLLLLSIVASGAGFIGYQKKTTCWSSGLMTGADFNAFILMVILWAKFFYVRMIIPIVFSYGPALLQIFNFKIFYEEDND